MLCTGVTELRVRRASRRFVWEESISWTFTRPPASPGARSVVDRTGLDMTHNPVWLETPTGLRAYSCRKTTLRRCMSTKLKRRASGPRAASRKRTLERHLTAPSHDKAGTPVGSRLGTAPRSSDGQRPQRRDELALSSTQSLRTPRPRLVPRQEASRIPPPARTRSRTQLRAECVPLISHAAISHDVRPLCRGIPQAAGVQDLLQMPSPSPRRSSDTQHAGLHVIRPPVSRQENGVLAPDPVGNLLARPLVIVVQVHHQRGDRQELVTAAGNGARCSRGSRTAARRADEIPARRAATGRYPRRRRPGASDPPFSPK